MKVSMVGSTGVGLVLLFSLAGGSEALAFGKLKEKAKGAISAAKEKVAEGVSGAITKVAGETAGAIAGGVASAAAGTVAEQVKTGVSGVAKGAEALVHPVDTAKKVKDVAGAVVGGIKGGKEIIAGAGGFLNTIKAQLEAVKSGVSEYAAKFAARREGIESAMKNFVATASDTAGEVKAEAGARLSVLSDAISDAIAGANDLSGDISYAVAQLKDDPEKGRERAIELLNSAAERFSKSVNIAKGALTDVQSRLSSAVLGDSMDSAAVVFRDISAMFDATLRVISTVLSSVYTAFSAAMNLIANIPGVDTGKIQASVSELFGADGSVMSVVNRLSGLLQQVEKKLESTLLVETDVEGAAPAPLALSPEVVSEPAAEQIETPTYMTGIVEQTPTAPAAVEEFKAEAAESVKMPGGTEEGYEVPAWAPMEAKAKNVISSVKTAVMEPAVEPIPPSPFVPSFVSGVATPTAAQVTEAQQKLEEYEQGGGTVGWNYQMG